MCCLVRYMLDVLLSEDTCWMCCLRPAYTGQLPVDLLLATS